MVLEDGGSSDAEKEAAKVTALPPSRVNLPTNSPVLQIAAGMPHTRKLGGSLDKFVLIIYRGQVNMFHLKSFTYTYLPNKCLDNNIV